MTEPTTPVSSKKNVSPLSALRDSQWSVRESPRQGRCSQTFFLDRESTGENEELFVKKVLVMSPDNANDKAFREQRILSALTQLRTQGRCFNFVSLLDSGMTGDGEFVEMVLERAGATLRDSGELTMAEMREICFQLVYALHAAQSALRFVHYDLHDKNILLQPFPDHGAGRITLHDGRSFFCSRKLVKIADFGLARMETTDGESIYNTKNATRGAFDRVHDLSELASSLAGKKISDRLSRVEEAQQFKQLRVRMKSRPPSELLDSPFFVPLMERPVGTKVVMEASEAESNTKGKSKKAMAEMTVEGTENTMSPRQSPRKKKQM